MTTLRRKPKVKLVPGRPAVPPSPGYYKIVTLEEVQAGLAPGAVPYKPFATPQPTPSVPSQPTERRMPFAPLGPPSQPAQPAPETIVYQTPSRPGEGGSVRPNQSYIATGYTGFNGKTGLFTVMNINGKFTVIRNG